MSPASTSSSGPNTEDRPVRSLSVERGRAVGEEFDDAVDALAPRSGRRKRSTRPKRPTTTPTPVATAPAPDLEPGPAPHVPLWRPAGRIITGAAALTSLAAGHGAGPRLACIAAIVV